MSIDVKIKLSCNMINASLGSSVQRAAEISDNTLWQGNLLEVTICYCMCSEIYPDVKFDCRDGVAEGKQYTVTWYIHSQILQTVWSWNLEIVLGHFIQFGGKGGWGRLL